MERNDSAISCILNRSNASANTGSPCFKKVSGIYSIISNVPIACRCIIYRCFESMAGDGYNRRAKYLQDSAQIITRKHNGIIPEDQSLLVKFPGIGKATAASIITFTYNKPLIFIETNIRRVFIHHFFKDEQGIDDSAITPLVEKNLDRENPREWYYLVMDYGTFLAKTVENPNRKSKHYAKQSKFEGSNRQIRGTILRELINESLSREELLSKLSGDKDRINRVLDELIKEKFISEDSKLKIR